MKKYNLSNIMKEAWKLYKDFQKCVAEYKKTFSECLKIAWAWAKERVAKAEKVAENIVTALDICGAEVMVNVSEGTIYGETWKCSKYIRKYGFKFNSKDKVWEGTSELVRKFAESWV